MIVPGVPQYLTEEDVAALRIGDTHHIDSGLGGSFTIRFEGHDGDKYVFRGVSPEWKEYLGELRYTFDEVRQSVYDIVAENPHFRSRQQSKPSA